MVTTTTGLATSFIQFSRPGATGGGATVTDRDGKIKWAGHNLLTNSESFDASAWTKDNTGALNPVVTANYGTAPNGTQTADRIVLNKTGGLYSRIMQTVGNVSAFYTFSVWMRTTGGGTSNVGLRLNSDGVNCVVTGVWTLFSVTLTAASATQEAQILLFDNIVGNDETADILAWGAHLYRSDLGGMVLNPARGDAYYPTTPPNLAKYTESWGVGAFGWTIGNIAAVANYAVAPNGLQTADLIYPTSTGTNRQTYQSTAGAVSGTRVVVSAYLKSGGMQWVGLLSPNGNNYGCYFDLVNGVKGTEAAGVTGTITSVGNGWYRCSVSQVLSSTTIYGGISLADADNSTTVTANGTSGIYAWGLQMSDSASLDAYSPVYGAAVTSAAYYAPRLDYSGSSLAALGLLVEEQRGNAVTHSSEFTQWSQGGSSAVTANVVVAPDGTTTADDIERVAADSDRRLLTVSFTGDGSKALSVFVKYNTSPSFLLRLYDSSAAAERAFIEFTFTAGVPAAGTPSAGSVEAIENVGGGWYRIKIVASGVVAANTNQFMIYPARAGSANGQKTTFWGAQAEVQTATFSTSLIPTNGATATRTADVASVSTQAFPYSASEGTVVVSGDVLSVANTNSANLWSFYIDSNNIMRSWIWDGAKTTPRGTVVVAGSTSAEMTNGTVTANTPFKTGTALKQNDFAFSLNGASPATDPSGPVIAATNALWLGSLGGTAASSLNGHIRQITYLPRRISNSELQARTV